MKTKHKEASNFSKEEQRAIQTQKRQSFENNHYSVGLLWKGEQPSLINNQSLASTRL